MQKDEIKKMRWFAAGVIALFIGAAIIMDKFNKEKPNKNKDYEFIHTHYGHYAR